MRKESGKSRKECKCSHSVADSRSTEGKGVREEEQRDDITGGENRSSCVAAAFAAAVAAAAAAAVAATTPADAGKADSRP